MLKVDLHTHSAASPDGGISVKQYQKALDSGLLDYIAVTDHNSVELALKLHQHLGPQIIVGEEIMTTQGEIIGLFLTKHVRPGQTPTATAQAIKDQGGLVYIPHPFETIRKGLSPQSLESLQGLIDIVEVANGRAFAQNRSHEAVLWAKLNHIPGVASSDAHGYSGLGRSYTFVQDQPSVKNLRQLLKSGKPVLSRPSLPSLLHPKLNRLKRKLGR